MVLIRTLLYVDVQFFHAFFYYFDYSHFSKKSLTNNHQASCNEIPGDQSASFDKLLSRLQPTKNFTHSILPDTTPISNTFPG